MSIIVPTRVPLLSGRLPKPLIDIDFTAGYMDSRISFTRASTATYFDSAGVMQTAAVNTPRFDHDPANNNAPLGFLGEMLTRTNLCLQSEDFSTTWTATRCSVAVNQSVFVDGATTMDEVAGLAVPASFANVSQTIAVLASTQYTLSAFLKQSTNAKMLFLVLSAGTTWDKTVNFTTGALEAGSNTAPDAATMTDMGGGIYRVSITVTTGAGETTLSPAFYLVPDGGTWATNSDVDDKFFIGGVQLELGAFPTSYIKTTTGSVVRAADVATLSLAGISGFSETAMTYFLELSAASVASSNPEAWAFSISDNSSSNTHDLAFDDGTEDVPRLFVFSGGTAQGNLPVGNVSAGEQFKIAWTVAENDITAFRFQSAVVQDATVTPLPTGLVNIKFGVRGNDGAPFTGHFVRFKAWRGRLSNGMLVGLIN